MARVSRFLPSTQNLGLHKTEVECEYKIVVDGDVKVLHLSTFGSEDRESHRKSSQSIQLDIEHARELIGILADFLASNADRER